MAVLDRIGRNENYSVTPGFWFRAGSRTVRNEPYPIADNLDELPLPELGVFDRQSILNYPAFSLSRGCPFKCAYCCASLYGERETGAAAVRIKSPARAIAEIQDMLTRYDPPLLVFDDDTFFKSKTWVHKFAALYKKEIGRPFTCNTRPETVNDDLVRVLKEANCSMISIGIESGDQELRREVLHRRMTDDRIVQAFETIRKHGIAAASFNMVGFPGESRERFQKTIALNRRVRPDLLQLTIFYPYRGTALGDLAHAQGYVVRRDYPTYFGRGTLDLPGFTLKAIEREALFFTYNVFKPVDRRRAVLGLAQSFGYRYPRLYCLVKKGLYQLKLTRPGWSHDGKHGDSAGAGAAPDAATTWRPTASDSTPWSSYRRRRTRAPTST